MKKVIKGIILAAATLVILIPTFVLAFQLARTAPEVLLGERELDPAFVTWSVTNRDGEDVITSISEKRAEKKFNRAEKVKLTTLDEVRGLTFPRAYAGCAVSIFALDDGELKENLSFEDFQEKDIPLNEPVQVIVVVLWQVSEDVRVKAAYSFEVTPV